MITTEQINILPYIAVSAVITYSLRLLPFVVFKDESSVPGIVRYIGKYLPPAVITGIVVYCFRAIDFTAFPYGVKEISAGAIVAGLHLWKRNTMLSVFTGTLFYMIAVQKY